MLGQVPRGTSFLIGLPALDAFPFETWATLYADRFAPRAPMLMRYDDPTGYRPLREAIAAFVGTARGVHCSADQVIVTTGSQQALEFSARILLDPGDPRGWKNPATSVRGLRSSRRVLDSSRCPSTRAVSTSPRGSTVNRGRAWRW